MFRSKTTVPVIGLVILATLLGACAAPTPEIREVEVPVEMEPAFSVPYEDQWAGSGHNNVEGEAFRHWDEDDPVEVPPLLDL